MRASRTRLEATWAAYEDHHDELHELVDALGEGRARDVLTYLQQLQRPQGVRDAPLDETPKLAEAPPVVVETQEEAWGDDVITEEEAQRRLVDPPATGT